MEFSGRRGFTLIELLIVVAIIAILAAIAVPNFIEAQTRSKVSRARTDLRTVVTALEAYAVDNNRYPPEMRQRAVSGTSVIWGFPPSQPFGVDGYNNPRVGPFETLSVRLTSPVAYLSSVMADPFKVNRTAQPGNVASLGNSQGRAYESGNPFDVSFMYHNIKMRVDAAQAGYTTADIADYGDWRIFSLGPMGLYWAIGTGDSSMGWKYDPTNGTMTSGFILRTQKDTTGENFSRS
jgi:prepilin-type N-terminal cleavage/methylation domain-containing protein